MFDSEEIEKLVTEFSSSATLRGIGPGESVDQFQEAFPNADWNHRGKWHLQVVRIGPFQGTFVRDEPSSPYQLLHWYLYLDQIEGELCKANTILWIEQHMKPVSGAQILELKGVRLIAIPTDDRPGEWYSVRAEKTEPPCAR